MRMHSSQEYYTINCGYNRVAENILYTAAGLTLINRVQVQVRFGYLDQTVICFRHKILLLRSQRFFVALKMINGKEKLGIHVILNISPTQNLNGICIKDEKVNSAVDKRPFTYNFPQ